MKKDAMLELVLISDERLVNNMKLRGSHGCNDHELLDFKILRVSKRVCSKLAPLDFKREDFELFRELFGRVTWEKATERRGDHESSLVFKDHLIHAQKQCSVRKRNAGKNARRPLRINGELLDLLKYKKKVDRKWKQEQVTWKDNKVEQPGISLGKLKVRYNYI